jgi:hypothetical protein
VGVEQRSFNNNSALGAGQSDIDLSVDIPPFWRRSQANDEFLEVGAMLRRILEPRQEVEGFAKFPAVMEPPRVRMLYDMLDFTLGYGFFRIVT